MHQLKKRIISRVQNELHNLYFLNTSFPFFPYLKSFAFIYLNNTSSLSHWHMCGWMGRPWNNIEWPFTSLCPRELSLNWVIWTLFTVGYINLKHPLSFHFPLFFFKPNKMRLIVRDDYEEVTSYVGKCLWSCFT